MSANVSTFFKAVNQNSGIPLASSTLRQTLENQNVTGSFSYRVW